MIVNRSMRVSTQGNGDIIDITDKLSTLLNSSGINDGILTVFVTGSTAGVSTIEYEEGLISDFKALWERIAPQKLGYAHNDRWGDGNGFSHVRASLLGASLTIPFMSKKLTLGTWQQVILVDFDNRPRTRNINLQIMGE
jgi:secondary thiamine-phosphate synthase enzyme